MRRMGLVLAGSLALLAGRALARDIELRPRGPWNLDYADERCTLAHALGTEETPAFIQFVRTSPGDSFRLQVIGKQFASVANLQEIRLRFGKDGPFVSQQAVTGKVRDLPVLFLTGRLDNWMGRESGTHGEPEPLPAISPEREAAISALQLVITGRTITLELGSLGKPMAALRDCTASLVKSWGLDPVEQMGLLHGPVPRQSPANWIRSGDYPTLPLHAGEQAIIDFRLMVGQDGQPTACVIQSNIAASGNFARDSCALLMRRARFAPAQRADGTPVASYYANRVRWVIP